MKLHPLINNQHIIIDNHHPGTPFKWDWQEDEHIDDIHLDKSLNRKVNGKKVCIRISLNNDHGVSEPKRCERENKEWIKAYNDMREEVIKTLNANADVRNQLVADIILSIKEIGPNKENRAIRKALMRIAKHFGLDRQLLTDAKDVKRGAVNLFSLNNVQYYVGFGFDCNFYLGEGNALDFSRRVKPSLIEHAVE